MLGKKQSTMRSTSIVLASILSISCNDNSAQATQCPTIAVPVVIPAVTIHFFDENKTPLDICDVIVSISSEDYQQTLYGSSFDNCTARFSLSGGYNLTPHDVLVEKAGYHFQQFEDILPIKTKCSYDPYKLDVYLEVD